MGKFEWNSKILTVRGTPRVREGGQARTPAALGQGRAGHPMASCGAQWTKRGKS